MRRSGQNRCCVPQRDVGKRRAVGAKRAERDVAPLCNWPTTDTSRSRSHESSVRKSCRNLASLTSIVRKRAKSAWLDGSPAKRPFRFFRSSKCFSPASSKGTTAAVCETLRCVSSLHERATVSRGVAFFHRCSDGNRGSRRKRGGRRGGIEWFVNRHCISGLRLSGCRSALFWDAGGGELVVGKGCAA